eukprot:TRINITY_DN12001_c0_g1_i1.p1 TRINITY_DN12001_c0_g1~~TRINITY_DN12001_c0_g1_i1.p1  ORF type:complete len:697 (+),score=130.89 TRINITY_DN12001_c0_g1_i1:24-2114(+)
MSRSLDLAVTSLLAALDAAVAHERWPPSPAAAAGAAAGAADLLLCDDEATTCGSRSDSKADEELLLAAEAAIDDQQAAMHTSLLQRTTTGNGEPLDAQDDRWSHVAFSIDEMTAGQEGEEQRPENISNPTGRTSNSKGFKTRCSMTAGCGVFRAGDPCHCNPQCWKYNSCCEDYLYACNRLCAKTSCGTYIAGASCQCNAACKARSNCCNDYDSHCKKEPEECKPGFGGPNCASRPCTDLKDCNGHGKASGWRPQCTCDCDAEWQGKSCLDRPCDSSDCNGHGTASGLKGNCQCECDEGWAGDTCAGPPCSDERDCNGRGKASGYQPLCTCECEKGYDGVHCQKVKATSCRRLGCGADYVKGNVCQCALSCLKYENCCDDFLTTCEKEYYKPEDKKLLEPSDGETFTFYMYRAQSEPGEDGYYPVENVNLGTMGGVLWYLHNEIIQTCSGAGGIGGSRVGGTGVWGDRKFQISRIRRVKISMKATQPLLDKGMNWGPLCSYDAGECTGPHRGTYWSGVGSGWGSKNEWDEYGFILGCGRVGLWPHQHWHSGWKYPDAFWYSVAGPCPAVQYGKRWDTCTLEMPGGKCEVPTGAGNCTYSVEEAGDIDLDELVGIKPKWESRAAFCSQCGAEGSAWSAGGCGLNFWGANIWDEASNKAQVEKALEMFEEKYPEMASHEDMLPPECDFDKAKYGFVRE